MLRIVAQSIGLCALLFSSVYSVASTPLGKALQSPALTPALHQPVLAQVSGSYWLNDADSLLSELLDTAEAVRGLIAESNQQLILFPGDADPVIAQMKSADGRRASARGALGLAAPLPITEHWLFSVGGDGRLSGTFNYDPEDESRIRLAITTGGLTGADLESTVDAAGVLEVDLAVQRAWGWQAWQLGLVLKAQHIILHQRSIPLSEYEDDDLFDRGRDTRSYYHGNLSLGLARQFGQWHWHTDIENIIAREFEGPLGEQYHLRPQWRMGIARDTRLGQLSLHSELTARQGFGLVSDTQWHDLEWRFAVHPKLDLAVGGRWVQKGDDDHSLSLAMDYHLPSDFHLGAFVRAAGSRQLGAGVDVQFFF